MTNPVDMSTPVAEVRYEDLGTHEAVRMIALRQIEMIKNLKDEKRLITESKKDILLNDSQLSQAEADAEDYLQKIKEAKARIKAEPQTMALNIKDKELRDEIKEVGATLSNHLIKYTKLTGSNFIEDENGKELRIKQKVSVHSGQQRLF